MTRTGYKIIAIILLIIFIAIISIIKSCLSENREKLKNLATGGLEEKASKERFISASSDSLRFYRDSIRTLEKFYRAHIARLLLERQSDSTRYYADSIEKLEAFYRTQIERPKYAQATVGGGEVAMEKELPESDDSGNRAMLLEYDSLLAQLPTGLGIREKEIALSKIYFELSRKFNISPDSLRKALLNRE
jgi:hypothetical protein